MRKKRNSPKTIFFRNFRFFGVFRNPEDSFFVSRKNTKIRNFPKTNFVATYPAINFRNFRLFGVFRNPEDSYYCIPFKQRGRTGRGACGDLPLSSLESDVGLAGPVGVDSDTDGGGGAAT